MPGRRGWRSITSHVADLSGVLNQEDESEKPMSRPFCKHPRCPCHARRICLSCGDPVPPFASAIGATRCPSCERAHQARVARRHQPVKVKE